jgi:hypothetical protein
VFVFTVSILMGKSIELQFLGKACNGVGWVLSTLGEWTGIGEEHSPGNMTRFTSDILVSIHECNSSLKAHIIVCSILFVMLLAWPSAER